MDNNYTVTIHIGRRTETGFATRFKLVSKLNGDKPYRAAESTMAILDEKVLEKTGLQLILDINGVFIPNDFNGKAYTVEEAYNNAMRTDVDLFLDMLKGVITGEHSND